MPTNVVRASPPSVNQYQRRASIALVLAALCLIGLASQRSAGQAPELSRRVDELIAKRVKPRRPGMAVLVVERGDVVHSKGYGLADLKTQRPVTPQTIFDLASVSKQFTAMAVLAGSPSTRPQTMLSLGAGVDSPEQARHESHT